MSESAVTETKVCRKCGVGKALDDFHVSPRSRGGYTRKCKACFNADQRAVAKTKPPRKRVPRVRNRPAPTVPSAQVCRGCAVEKPIAEFPASKTRPWLHTVYCHTCRRDIHRAHVRAHRNRKMLLQDALPTRPCKKCLLNKPREEYGRRGRNTVCKVCWKAFFAHTRGVARKRRPPEERFWEKVDKNGPMHPYKPELGCCWIWTGATMPRGYGNFGISKGNPIYAHRYAWELANGPVPPGLFVLHGCDVPGCVRADGHLRVGTQLDNVADMMSRQRDVRVIGEDAPSAKLTVAKVVAMRAQWDAAKAEEEMRFANGGDRRGRILTHRQLAKEFGVGRTAVDDIVHRRTWKHVD